MAKGILDAIMSGHVEGMPGENAEMAEDAAQEEAPRGARRCSAHACILKAVLRTLTIYQALCEARQPEILRSASNCCEVQLGSRRVLR